MPTWIVVRSQPARENYTAENCARQGYAVFLPKILEHSGRGTQRIALSKPLFPSYLFVGIDGRWHSLLSTYGVRAVLLRGDSPATVPLAVIDELKRRQNEDGLIVLPRRRRGDQVRIARGVFAGHEGIYLGMNPQQRVRVLLSLLGGKTRVLIAEQDLTPA
jgi:transcriptional antiterminator RfaH